MKITPDATYRHEFSIVPAEIYAVRSQSKHQAVTEVERRETKIVDHQDSRNFIDHGHQALKVVLILRMGFPRRLISR